VKTRELPEADDEFAQMVSEFDTIAELTDDLREQAANSKRSEQAVEARTKLIDVLLERTEILLPADVVDHEVGHRVSEDASEEERSTARADVERELREEILSESLAERYEVKVSQQELIDYMIQMSQTFGTDINQLIRDSSQVSELVGQLGRTKALIQALRSVTVKDSEGDDVDLTPFFGDDGDEDEAASGTAASGDAASEPEETDSGDAADADASAAPVEETDVK
jgi:trigger factor